MKSQKIMIEEAMMAEVKGNDKMSISKVALKMLDVERDCMVIVRNGSKIDTVQIRYVNNDNTIDQLEIKFKGKSFTIEKGSSTTNEFNMLDPYKVLSEVKMGQLDLNKIAVNLGGLYVPAVIILSKFLKDRATSKTLTSILKEFELIDEKRMKVTKDDKGIEIINIDLNAYNTGDTKPVNLRNDSWKRLGSIITDLRDNKRCIEIFDNSTEAFETIVEEEKEIKNQNLTGEEEKTDEKGENEMNTEVKNLRDEIEVKGLELVEAFVNLKDDIKMDEIVKIVCSEKDSSLLINLKPFRAYAQLEMNDDTRDASTEEEFVVLGKAMNTLAEFTQDKFDTEENSIAFIKGVIVNKITADFGDKEGIEEINIDEIVDNAIHVIESKIKQQEEVSEETKEEEPKVIEENVQSKEVEDNEEKTEEVKVNNNNLTITNSNEDKKSDDTFDIGVRRISISLANTDETVEENESTNKEEELKLCSNELTNSKVKELEDDYFIDGKVVRNSVLKYCTLIEGGDIKVACDKYEEVLSFIEEYLEPSKINEISKEYKSVGDALGKYTKQELRMGILQRFDCAKSLISALYNNVPGYGRIISVLKTIPLKLVVNIVYCLTNEFDRTLESMCFDEKVKFYTLFEEMLDLYPDDLVEGSEKSILVQKAFALNVKFNVHNTLVSDVEVSC